MLVQPCLSARKSRRLSLRVGWVAAAFGFACFVLAPCARCEEDKPAKKVEKKAGDEEKGPKPESLVLTTGDGVQLGLTYYPGRKGRESIPVVLLHGWKESRAAYKDLAPALQQLGYAVIVPDLRGHGESTRMKGGRKDETLDAAKMPPAQFGLMVAEDMKAIGEFLWLRNNAGELNLDKLCVVGAEMGASVAINFAKADAIAQDRNTIPRAEYKLGRFVKALVLISPELSFHGLPTRPAAVYPAVQSDISVLILVGRQDHKALQEATRIHGLFRSAHPEPTGDNKLDKQTLFFGKLDTKLQGTKLLDPKFNLQGIIADFIFRRLVKSDESREWPWRERKFPHA
jgi:alpha-beta hydrolase superfamily lysophospholipase